MYDSFMNAAKIGMGAMWLSRENLKKLTDDLVEMSKVSREEGERLFAEFEKNGEEYKQKFNDQVDTSIQKALDQAGLVKKYEFEALEQRLADLEAKLSGQDGD